MKKKSGTECACAIDVIGAILRIERLLGFEVHGTQPKGLVPGTSLQRILQPDASVGWVLGVGHMGERREFFTGKSITEVLTQAEKWAVDQDKYRRRTKKRKSSGRRKDD